jgi:hypothetical protein
MDKIKLNIILPGGGAKCIFQLGFLDAISKSNSFWEKFEIESVKGASGGSITGAYFVTGELDKLKEKMTDPNAVNKLLVPWVGIPLIGSYLNIPVGFYKRSMFRKDGLRWMLDKLDLTLTESDNEKIPGLKKFKVVSTLLDNGTHFYVDGTDPKLHQYIIASASLWGAFEPEEIDGKMFADGGLTELLPFGNNETNVYKDATSKWKLDQTNKFLYIDTQIYDIDNEYGTQRFKGNFHPGSNLLEYSMKIIDLVTSLNGYINYHHYMSYSENNNIYHIKYPINDLGTCQSSLDFGEEKSLHTYDVGFQAGLEFIQEHCPEKIIIEEISVNISIDPIVSD